MQFLYANIVSFDNPGTLVKIGMQARALQESGSARTIAFYEGTPPDLSKFDPAIDFVPLPKFRKRLGLFQLPVFLNRYFKDAKADVVVLRSMRLTPAFWYAFRKRRYCLITEHHTLIVPELLARKHYLLALSTILSTPFANRVIDGKVCVTGEIADTERFPKPMAVIPNGSLMDPDSVTSFAPFDGQTMHILILCSQYHQWHGLERFFKSVCDWEKESELNFRIHVVGNLDASELRTGLIPKGVVFHGQADEQGMTEIARQCNLAISTLALYTKEMQEACPRKSRDYICRGIPFIYGYSDPDLNENDAFAMRVSNDDSEIPLNSVLEFVSRINDRRSEIEKSMEDAAHTRISWKAKMRDYLNFARTVQANTRPEKLSGTK